MTERGKNLIQLGLIVGIFAAFFIVGHFFMNPANMPKVNRGHLIVPHVHISKLGLTTTAGEGWNGDKMKGHWWLMYIGDGKCERGCKNALFYLMMRVREALGADSPRVKLLMVQTEPPSQELNQFLQNKIKDITVLKGQAPRINAAFSGAFDRKADQDARNRVYMVAPDGQIFMWYPTHKDMKGILKEGDNIHTDLTRTLKGSLIG